MKKYLFLLLFFLVSCKKNITEPRINITQQPSRIQVFSVDTLSGAQTLQYQIDYFYNTDLKRFDSIIIATQVYKFDYSKLTTENKILINYTTDLSSHQELIFDANFYKLNQYNLINSINDTVKNKMQYDSGNRLIEYAQTNTLSPNSNFNQIFNYKGDTVFVSTNRPSDACVTNDTIFQSYKEMSTILPYITFLNLTSSCGEISNNILQALPMSNFTYNLPLRKVNSSTETIYTFKGDSKYRLGEANILDRNRATNQLVKITKILITY